MAAYEEKDYTSKVSYKRTSETTGLLTRTGTKIMIHDFSDSDETEPMVYGRAVDVAHPNYLRCLVPDLENRMLLYEEADMSGFAHLEAKGTCFKLFTPPDACKPDKGVVKNYYCVREEYRAMVKGLLSLLGYLHSKEKDLSLVVPSGSLCLSKNILFKGAVLKLWYVGFKKANNASRKKDYELVYKLNWFLKTTVVQLI